MGRKLKNIRNEVINSSTNKARDNDNKTLDDDKININIDIKDRFKEDTILNSAISGTTGDTSGNYIENTITTEQNKNNKNINEIDGTSTTTKTDSSTSLELFDLPNTSWLELASSYQSVSKRENTEVQPYQTKMTDQEKYDIKTCEVNSDSSRNTSNSPEIELHTIIPKKQLANIFSNNDNNTVKLKINHNKTSHNKTNHIQGLDNNFISTETHHNKANKHNTKNKEEESVDISGNTSKLSRKKSNKSNHSSRAIRVWRLNEKDRLEKVQQRNRISALKSRQKKILKELEFKKEVENVMLENDNLKEKLGHYESIISKFINFIHSHMDGHDKNDKEDLGVLISDIKSIEKEVDIEENDEVKKFVEDAKVGADP